MHHIRGCLLTDECPYPSTPQVGGVFEITSSSWLACLLFPVKGSNQQWPLNCDVLITSPGNLVKMQILWQEVWGRTWDSGFPDVNAAVQGPHFEQQSHISPSHTFFFQLFTYSKCLVITKCLLYAMYHAKLAVQPWTDRPSLLSCAGKRQKNPRGSEQKNHHKVQAGKHWRDSDRNRVLWASAMVLRLWSIKI